MFTRHLKAPLFFTSLLIASLSFAGEDWSKFPVGPFSGLNNRDNSYAIPASNSQDLLNVELTPGGKSVKKRHGYGIAFTLNNTTSAVHGTYDFFDSNGNEVDLFFNDVNITGTTGSTLNVILSTAPNGATWQCTDSLGIAYCANSQRTSLYKITSSTLSTIASVASTGTMVATAVDRLAMAGFSDAPSRIDLSAAGDFTQWGFGNLGSSPAQFTINAPGAKITHITYAFGRLMWFKDTSFGYILIGNQPLQTDWVVKTVSYDVGTNDNTSVYREGILYFRGKDGHIYTFDGYTYQRLSREISGTVALAQTRSVNSWIQTSQTDFGNGTFDNVVFGDTNTVPGSVVPAFPDEFNSLRTGGSSKDVWIATCQASGVCVSSVEVVGGRLSLSDNGGNLSSSYIRSVYRYPDPSPGTTYYFNISSMTTADAPSGGGNVSDLYFNISSNAITTGDFTSTQNSPLYFIFSSSENNTLSFRIFASTLDSCGNAVTPCTSNSFSFPQDVQVYVDTSVYQVTIGTTIVKRQSFSVSMPVSQKYIYLNYRFGGASGHAYIDRYSVIPGTFTYYSAVNNAPALTANDQFTSVNTNSGGTESFSFRARQGVFALTSSTPAWESINNGGIPVSTGVYLQIGDYFYSNSTASILSLNSFTFNWFEGSASDKTYATYFEDKIMFSAPIGTGTTTNNKVLIYDLLSQGWLLWDTPVNGFYVKANRLYFGSSNGGYIYKYGDVENDAGAAINSYWKSKDFFGDDPFTMDEVANISMIAKSVASSTMTINYTLNGSSTSSFLFPTQSNNSFINKNRNLPAGTIANNSFNIQFGNNAADQPFEVFGIQLGLRPKSWIPSNP